jgi:hypothetical protein
MKNFALSLYSFFSTKAGRMLLSLISLWCLAFIFFSPLAWTLLTFLVVVVILAFMHPQEAVQLFKEGIAGAGLHIQKVRQGICELIAILQDSGLLPQENAIRFTVVEPPNSKDSITNSVGK